MNDTGSSHSSSIECVLAVDSRLDLPNFFNDQIWEFSSGVSEPPALMLHTTYGLRAYWLKLFPSFSLDGVVTTDPRTFHAAPELDVSTPSYLRFRLSPFPSIDVQMEFWVPSSQCIAGRVQIKNSSPVVKNFRLIWNTQLNPIGRGQHMTAQQFGLNTVLQGHTQNLAPVFYVTGGPEPLQSPYPALAVNMLMQPGLTRTITWALASLRTLEESFNLARQVTGRNWENELLRIEMITNRQTCEVKSGNPNQDRVFMFSQNRANQLLMCSPGKHTNRSFVLNRTPDQGFSLHGDGSDYGPAWTGQTPLKAWYYAKFLLPGNPDCVKGILQHFFDDQGEDGTIHHLIGFAGSSSEPAAPILADIAWSLYRVTNDKDWLKRSYSALLRSFKRWLTSRTDETRRFIPSWSSPAQAEMEDFPAFAPQNLYSSSENLTGWISPGLLAMLYREGDNIKSMARVLELEEDLAWLEEELRTLKDIVEKTWDPVKHSYTWRDLETGAEIKDQKLCSYKSNGTFSPNKVIQTPARINVCVQRSMPGTSQLRITLQGHAGQAMISEELTSRQMTWQLQYGRVISAERYTSLDSVKIEGLNKGDSIHLFVAGTTIEDASLLLPLWSGICDASKIGEIIEKTLIPRYLTGMGISNLPRPKPGQEFPVGAEVNLVWNSMLIEGLTRYGYNELAAEVFSSLVDQCTASLADNNGVFPTYSLADRSGLGEKNSLTSLIAVNDLLRVCGVGLWTDHEMILSHLNAYFPPITVKYNRTKIKLFESETRVQTISGDTQVIEAPLPRRILFT